MVIDPIPTLGRNVLDKSINGSRLVRVLGLKDPAKELVKSYHDGTLDELLPGYLPLKSRSQKNDFEKIISNLGKIEMDFELRLTILLSPCDDNTAKSILKKYQVSDASISRIEAARNGVDEFNLINNKIKLKRYIHDNGWNYYHFLTKYVKALNDVMDLPSYKVLSKDYMVGEILQRQEVIFQDDLKIEKGELVDRGIIDEDKVNQIMEALTLHCQIAPNDNKHDTLIEKAMLYNNHPLARIFSGIRWIK